MKQPDLLDDVHDVVSGIHLPRASSAEYLAASLRAAPGPQTDALRRAAAIARMFEGDAEVSDFLGLSEDPNWELRMETWFDLIELAQPHQILGETRGETLRRLVETNSAAISAFMYVVTEPRG